MFPKEMYISKRCFGEHNKTISEVVSAGYSCVPIRYVYIAFPDTPNNLCIPQPGFENFSLEEGVTRLWSVCEDIKAVVFKAKSNLKENEQILLCELYEDKLHGISDFEFCGYDLLESGASAIHDCDFIIDNINSFGLISTIEDAVEVSTKLREEYPYEQHAHCDIYAIWRYIKK